ncbi:MAG TPA: PAS domain S-box protein, partial [Chthoniobacterales bacterium]|nr:PAS domain S-box protein [Chthoniobacterales bacterium]
ARDGYLRWGADGKVRQLDQLYPHLCQQEPAPGPTSTIGAPVEHLDLATVIKVSQAVSGEIVLEKLIDTLMRTAIEHAGAERGLLILSRGIELRIQAEATTSGDSIIVRLREAFVAEGAVPESIVHYVVRTQESVILDDASAQNPFSTDSYICQHHARSILCLPLINQGKLIGALYLENNLTPHVFTPTRIAALKLLASQAAMSLENTRLYRDLEEREAKIRRLVDANIVGIFTWELEGRILEANCAFLRMVGYDREDLASGRLRWAELTPPEWLDRDAQQWMPELKMTGSLQPFEKEYFRKDGSRVPVLIGAAIFEGSKNEGVAFVLDLTKQKRAEEALRRSEANLADAQRLSQTGSFGWDVSSGKIYWSQETFRIFECDPATEPTAELVLHRTHPEDRALVRQLIDRVSQERKVFDFEHRLLMPNESVKYLRVVGRPSKDESGRFEFVGAVTDITERKRAEEELHQKEVSLREAQAELAHVSRVTTMGELAASIAHEVNQPLAGIVTNANASLRWLAGDSPNLAEAREAIRRIVRDGNRAGEVVSRMRALFKKTRTTMESLDINEAIEEVVILTQSEARRNKVTLRMELAANLPPVLGDRVQLQQVIMNLILNAIEAMSTVGYRERDLVIRTRRGDGDEVRVAVRDSGIGLDPVRAERMFDAFHTTKPGGLGMGLSISRSIVESHGGRLWAISNEGPGATFQFTLLKCQ